MAVTEEEMQHDIKRHDSARKAVERHRERRDKFPLKGAKKVAFIAAFVANRSVEDYPRPIEEDPGRIDYESDLLKSLTQEIVRASEVVGDDVDVSALVPELLASSDEALICCLEDTPLHDLELGRVLAHVEALGYPLSKRMAATVAHRTMLLLLNKRRFPGPSLKDMQHFPPVDSR